VTDRAATLLEMMDTGVLATIGDTPLVGLRHLMPDAPFELFAKLESFNPSGSIKDRPALGMLRGALERGEIDGETTVIESSSGNLGVALAFICRFLKLRFVCVADPLVTEQNVRLMEVYGAAVEQVTEPDAAGSFLKSRVRRVRELLAATPNSYWCNQYENPDNASAHQRTMEEIVKTLDGPPGYLFCATGTYGTLRGCADYLKPRFDTTVVAVDAEGSVIHGGEPGRRLIPGHGSSIVPGLFRPGLADRVVHVSDGDSVAGCRLLLEREGILAGGSSGAVVRALANVAPTIERGARCVAIICDRGVRYLDTIYNDTWVEKALGGPEGRAS
jgi:cysteine synthase A